MGAAQPTVKPVRLGPPLSLRALKLSPDSSVAEAVDALIRSREEIQSLRQPKSQETEESQHSGGASASDSKASASSDGAVNRELPSKDELFVLLDRGDSADAEVLGGSFAYENGECSLSDLGVEEENADSGPDAGQLKRPTLRLCLAAAPATEASQQGRWRQRCGACCSRRGCRRCARNFSRRTTDRIWRMLPEKWQARVEGWLKQWTFYTMCARIAVRFLWQDRHDMIKEFKAALFVDLCAPEDGPPCRWSQVMEELRPFTYAFALIGLHSAWDVGSKRSSAH